MNMMEIIKEQVMEAVKILDEKKGMDLSVLDVQGVLPYTDYIIIANGISDRHVGALADNLQKELSKKKVKLKHSEGNIASGWIILDFIDFIVHIFSKEQREYYGIDEISEQAKKIDIDFLN